MGCIRRAYCPPATDGFCRRCSATGFFPFFFISRLDDPSFSVLSFVLLEQLLSHRKPTTTKIVIVTLMELTFFFLSPLILLI